MDNQNTAAAPKKRDASTKQARKEPRGTSSPSRSESVEFDPQLIWITIRRCWLWATPTGLALAATAAFIVFSLFVPVFQATHLLEANMDYVVFRDTIPTSSNLANTEKNLIFTDIVLDKVVSDPEIQVAPEFGSAIEAKDLLRKNLSIGNAGSDTLLTISFKDPDPKFAALVCNKVTESYLAQRERLDNERVSNLESWLAPSLDLWKAEVAGHEKRVRELSKTALGFDPSKRVESLENDLSLLSSLRMQLANLMAEESIVEARVAMIASERDATAADPANLPEIIVPDPTSSEIAAFVDADNEVRRLRGELSGREQQVQSLEDRGLASIRQDHLRELQAQIAKIKGEIRSAEETAKKSAPEILKRNALEVAQRNRTAQLAQQKVAVQMDRNAEQRKLAELKVKRAIVQKEYDAEKKRLEQHGGNTADLLFAQEDREIAVDILSQLNQRVAAIRTERRRGSGVHTMAEATPPHKPIEPMPVKHMAVAAAGGFMLPFLLGLLWEFRSGRISDVAAIESRALAPVMGEVAKLPSRVGGGKRHRVFEESIDTLRANFMLCKETTGVRSVTIASSMSGEGKSSVASQLAISIAKACGKTVLLIDADLRSPDQHDIFGLEMGPGLVKVLSGEVPFNKAVDRSLGSLVHVLPAGRMTQSPHRLLNASALRDLFDQALAQYAYVVVDTAPVLAAGETLAIASETDATLICVMRDVSRLDTALRCSRRLEAAGANLVGTVFSGVPSSQYAYRYGDYRYINAGRPVT